MKKVRIEIIIVVLLMIIYITLPNIMNVIKNSKKNLNNAIKTLCDDYRSYSIKSNLNGQEKDDCVDFITSKYPNINDDIEISENIYDIATTICKHELTSSWNKKYDNDFNNMLNSFNCKTYEEFVDKYIRNIDLYEDNNDDIKKYFNINIGCYHNYLTQYWRHLSGINSDEITSITFYDISKVDEPNIDGLNGIDVSIAQNKSVLLYFNEDDGAVHIVSKDKIYFPTDSTGLFRKLINVKSIKFNDSIDTSNVTNMSRMFYGCENLGLLDLNNLDMSNAFDKSEMFCGVNTKRFEVDMSNFDTEC